MRACVSTRDAMLLSCLADIALFFFLCVYCFGCVEGWCGQIHPNKTQPWDSFNDITTACSKTEGKTGCLFDVLADPGEHVDLAHSMPEKANEIYAKMVQAEKHWFNPDRGAPDDPRACKVAKDSGYWQPFLP